LTPSTLFQVQNFRVEAERLNRGIERILSRYKELKTEKVRERIEELINKINESLQMLSRILIPVLYNVAGKYEYDPIGSLEAKLIPVLHPIIELSELNSNTGEFVAHQVFS